MGRKVIFVGWINKGKPADCGETMKNQLCIQKLEEFGIDCMQMDFKNWRKHPWVFIQLVFNIVAHRDATLLLSTSPQNVYPLIKALKKIGWKQNIVLWVIGGSLGQKVKQGIHRADVINFAKHILVESSTMVKELEECGVDGVIEVPNFKPIEYYPVIGQKYPNSKRPLRFVFLSRIMPEKGCDYILEATRLLNEEGYEKRFTVDFYGKIADGYSYAFNEKINSLKNATYQGFLNLREKEGYDQLSNYDMMLFPTYWRGEGFAGIFIDAFISGVPMIATDWAHNRIILEDGKTALFIPTHNVLALKEKMKQCISGGVDIQSMSRCCQNEAQKYDVNHVITEELLKRIEVM